MLLEMRSLGKRLPNISMRKMLHQDDPDTIGLLILLISFDL